MKTFITEERAQLARKLYFLAPAPEPAGWDGIDRAVEEVGAYFLPAMWALEAISHSGAITAKSEFCPSGKEWRWLECTADFTKPVRDDLKRHIAGCRLCRLRSEFIACLQIGQARANHKNPAAADIVKDGLWRLSELVADSVKIYPEGANYEPR